MYFCLVQAAGDRNVGIYVKKVVEESPAHRVCISCSIYKSSVLHVRSNSSGTFRTADLRPAINCSASTDSRWWAFPKKSKFTLHSGRTFAGKILCYTSIPLQSREEDGRRGIHGELRCCEARCDAQWTRDVAQERRQR